MGELVSIQKNEIISSSDIEVLRNSKFKGFTDAEVKYAGAVCQHLQLNPLLNQIHFVKRGNAITTQVGIDGFRLAAERTGKYAGSDEPTFEGSATVPTKATVTVYKMMEGQRCAFTASARWAEYYPGPGQDHMWKKMPFNQLAKCAEALALRKAFPAELGSLRTDEEMVQADGATVSKAKSLNDRAPKEPEVQEAEIVEQPPEHEHEDEVPECHGPMKISKYPNRDTGAFDWFCPTCKSKVARA